MTTTAAFNEAKRLRALHELAILDTAAEAAWNRIVLLATKVYNVPISLVTLVDDKRQWFKAKIGLAVDETSRESAFCAHAILDEKTMIVEDAHQDERFATNELVLGEPFIRFYAGSPIRAPNGQPLGTVCIIDRKPRNMSANETDALRVLADQAEELLAYRLASIKLRRSLAGQSNKTKQNQFNDSAHRINTPLTPVLLRLKSLQLSLKDDEPKSRMVQEMQRNLTQLQSAIGDLLQLSTGAPAAKKIKPRK